MLLGGLLAPCGGGHDDAECLPQCRHVMGVVERKGEGRRASPRGWA